MITAYLSVSQAAAMLGRSPVFVIHELNEGNLRGTLNRDGRWQMTPADVEAYAGSGSLAARMAAIRSEVGR